MFKLRAESHSPCGAGAASFLSFCQNPIYTDNMPCNQQQTNRVTKLAASQLAISVNYQLTYAGMVLRSFTLSLYFHARRAFV